MFQPNLEADHKIQMTLRDTILLILGLLFVMSPLYMLSQKPCVSYRENHPAEIETNGKLKRFYDRLPYTIERERQQASDEDSHEYEHTLDLEEARMQI